MKTSTRWKDCAAPNAVRAANKNSNTNSKFKIMTPEISKNLTLELRSLTTGVDSGPTNLCLASHQGTNSEIVSQGAHLTRFVTQSGDSLLFMPAEVHFEAGKAIRGGVPVIFPWFGPKKDDSNAPSHGFARTMEWQVEAAGDDFLTLKLESNPQTLAQWPHPFALQYRIGCQPDALQLSLQISNTGDAAFEFETALHTYLRVSDVRQIEIEGLGGKTYLDKVAGGARKTQQGTIAIGGEVDRVYLDSKGPITLRDGARTLKISDLGGVKSTVVWNPWIEKSRALSDLGDDEWMKFVCIESGVVADDKMWLEAGQSHEMSVEYRAETSVSENANRV